MSSRALGRSSGFLLNRSYATSRMCLPYWSGRRAGAPCCTRRAKPSMDLARKGSTSAIISYRMHPSAHMSALCPYGAWRNISGDMKMGVPMKVRAATLSSCSSRATPKSPSATRERPGAPPPGRWSRRRNTFWDLRSRCRVL